MIGSDGTNRSQHRLVIFVLAVALVWGGLIFVETLPMSGALKLGRAEAAPVPKERPTRIPRATRIPRPTRVPRPTRAPRPGGVTVPTSTAVPTATPPGAPSAVATATATATAIANVPPDGSQSCPGVPVTCPVPPACRTGNKIGQLYYKHPLPDPIITTKVGEMRLNRASNGFDPVREGGSFALLDKDNQLVAHMPNLTFRANGNGWIAEHELGWVTISPAPSQNGYYFQLQYNAPNFPPGYFSVVFQMCLSIGDDGIYEQIVCQPKARDAFLCHNNGPTW